MTRPFDLTGHAYVLMTLAFTVYGQLVLRWQMKGVKALPEPLGERFAFLVQQLFNPWIFSGMCGAFLASLAWMAAMTRLEMSYAYPFMSLAFVLVMAFGVAFLGEQISVAKVAGTLLVVFGLLLIARG